MAIFLRGHLKAIELVDKEGWFAKTEWNMMDLGSGIWYVCVILYISL